MKNKALAKLNLEDNRFGPTQIMEIVHSLKHNNAMISLNIANNRLDDEVGFEILKMLEVNTTIQEIIVSEDEIGIDSKAAMDRILGARI